MFTVLFYFRDQYRRLGNEHRRVRHHLCYLLRPSDYVPCRDADPLPEVPVYDRGDDVSLKRGT